MKVHGIHFKREKRLYSRKHVLLLLWGWAAWLTSPDAASPAFILGDISYAIPQCFFSGFNHKAYRTAGSAHHSPISLHSSEFLLSTRRTETSQASTLHPRELPVKSQPWKSLPEGCSFWGLTDLFLFGGTINPRLEMFWESPHAASNLLL